MDNRIKFIVLGLGATVGIIAFILVALPKQTGEDDLASSRPAATQPGPAQQPVQSAAQLDPVQPPPIPTADWQVPAEGVGPEEFYFTLASELQNYGFTEEYIAAVVGVYSGYEPRDFLAIGAPRLAEQLTQHMQSELGHLSATTDDAQDMLEIARDVYSELE